MREPIDTQAAAPGGQPDTHAPRRSPPGWALRIALAVALGVASLVVPKRRGAIVAGAGYGQHFTGDPKYFYLHLLGVGCQRDRPSRLRCTWITDNPELLRTLGSRGWPVVARFSWQGFWHLLRAEYWLLENGHPQQLTTHDVGYAWLPLGRFAIVNTWHGSTLVPIGLDADREHRGRGFAARTRALLIRYLLSRQRYVVAQSRHDVQVFEQAFANRRVQLLGSPRNDVFYGHQGRTQALRERLHLDRYQRVLVYLPQSALNTAGDHGDNGAALATRPHAAKPPFDAQFLTSLDNALRERSWILLIAVTATTAPPASPTGTGNILAVGTEGDRMELLAEAAVLVTDHLASALDFLCAKRPLVFYGPSIHTQAAVRRPEFEGMPGPFADTEAELAQLLLSSDEWFPSHEYQAQFQPFRGYFQPFERGSACARLEALLQHGHTPAGRRTATRR